MAEKELVFALWAIISSLLCFGSIFYLSYTETTDEELYMAAVFVSFVWPFALLFGFILGLPYILGESLRRIVKGK